MFHVIVKPCPALESYVKCYSCLSIEIPYETTFIISPDGCLEFIFNIGDPMNRSENGQAGIKSGNGYVLGQLSQYTKLVVKGNVKMIGVKIFPQAIKYFLDFGTNEITDSMTELGSLGSRTIKELEKIVNEEAHNDFSGAIAALETGLIRIISNHRRFDSELLNWALAEIYKRKGNVNLEELASEICVSKRLLEMRFLEYVGVSPKTFSTMIRFLNVKRYIEQNRDINFAWLTNMLGYSDHPHLIREFKKFSSVTPLAFLKKNAAGPKGERGFIKSGR